MDRIISLIGPGSHDLRSGSTVTSQGLRAVPYDCAPGGKSPVTLEQLTGLRNDRATQVEAQISPRRLAILALEVFCRQIATPAPQPCRALGKIDDQQFAMVAQVEATLQWRMQRRHEQRKLSARAGKPFQIRPTCHPAPHPVKQQTNANASACLFAQAIDDAVAERITSQDESTYLDRVVGRIDRIDQCPACGMAVHMHMQIMERDRRGLAERRNGLHGPRVFPCARE